MLVPPDNFGLVESGIYRCTKLESDNFPFLETLQLKSIVVLDAEKPPRLLKDFVQTNKIELYNLGGLKISNHNHTGASSGSNIGENEVVMEDEVAKGSYKGSSKSSDTGSIDVINLDFTNNKADQWMLIEKNLILGSFELLLNKTKYNTLLVDSTSTLIGILRKIQKWNLNSIVNEYRIYSSKNNKSNYYAESFLELVQTELVPFEVDALHRQKSDGNKTSGRRSAELGSPLEETVLNPGVELRSPDYSISKPKQNSVDAQCNDDEGNNSVDEEDMDEDILSASPQIPANLLKLVESRKEGDLSENSEDGKTPGDSPRNSKSYKNTNISTDQLLAAAKLRLSRRRSSTESRFSRSFSNSSSNFLFRNQRETLSGPSNSQTHKPLEDVHNFSKRLLTGERTKSIDGELRHHASMSAITHHQETDKIEKKYDYMFYKNLNKYPVRFENVNVLKIKLPPDHDLPDWFTKSRNSWEEEYNRLNT